MALGVLLGTSTAAIGGDRDAYVDANLLGIFYHELGHALIDIMSLPIFGQEEDAADVLSILLVDVFYDEETAVSIAYDAAFGLQVEADGAGDIAWWDVHGPDQQRYYNLVCLFYGANPDERADVATELGLPEERAESCEEEFDLASDSWGAVLDELASAGGDGAFALEVVDPSVPGAAHLEELLVPEIAALNSDFRLPVDLPVLIAACGEANAFYDPVQREITLCTEFVAHLEAQIRD